MQCKHVVLARDAAEAKEPSSLRYAYVAPYLNGTIVIRILTRVKITIARVRQIVLEEILREVGGGFASPPQPVGRSPNNGSDINSREALGKLEFGESDDDITAHLRDEYVTVEDDYGPVPPVAPEPYLMQDPLVRDISPVGSRRLRSDCARTVQPSVQIYHRCTQCTCVESVLFQR